MPNSINLNRFRFIKQNGDFCLLASIENVFKYHNENVDQYQIASMWRRNHTMQSISIPGIASSLKRSRFKNNFEYEVGGRTSSASYHDINFANEQALIDYIKNCCDNGNPLIVAIEGGGNSAHMLVVIGYLPDFILFFDSANHCFFPICVCHVNENLLIRNPPFKPDLPTLLIRPR